MGVWRAAVEATAMQAHEWRLYPLPAIRADRVAIDLTAEGRKAAFQMVQTTPIIRHPPHDGWHESVENGRKGGIVPPARTLGMAGAMLGVEYSLSKSATSKIVHRIVLTGVSRYW